MTKEEKKEYDKKWRDKNKERILGVQRAYRNKNQQTAKQYQKDYYAKNKIMISEKAKQYEIRTKEARKLARKKYKLVTKEKTKIDGKLYYEKNKEKINKRQQKNRIKNKEALAKLSPEELQAYKIKRLEYGRKDRAKFTKEQKERYRNQITLYRMENKEKVKQSKAKYYKNVVKNNLSIKIALILRVRLADAVKKKLKGGSAVRDMGCSLDFFIKYMESLFLEGMNWGNHAQKGWHIDHKIPLSKFDLTDPNQVKIACHYTNLQPLWWRDNLVKQNKIITE